MQLRARDEPGPELELVGDRACGDRVIAGDHAHVDPGVERDPNCLLGLGAQRIDDPDQRHQQEIGDGCHRIGARGRHRGVVDVANRECQDAESLLGHLLIRGEELGAHVGDRSFLAVPERTTAPVDDDVRCTLDRHEMGSVQDAAGQPVGPVVERRHELVLGVERHLGDARERGAGLLGADAHLRGEHDERRLGGIADDGLVVTDGRIAGEHQAEREAAEVGHRPAADAENRARLGVAAALDPEPLARRRASSSRSSRSS